MRGRYHDFALSYLEEGGQAVEWVRAAALVRQVPELDPSRLDEILNSAATIQDLGLRADALLALAPRMAALGQVERAIDTARSIESEGKRAIALARIGGACTETAPRQQALAEAVEVARGIENLEHRVKILSKVAIRLTDTPARDRLVRDILATAQSIEDVVYRSWALSALVDLFIELKRPSDGLDTARMIGHRVTRLHSIESLRCRLGDPDTPGWALGEAIDTAVALNESYFDHDLRPRALRTFIAQAATLPADLQHPIWSRSCRGIALQTRDLFLQDLVLFRPLIESLGGETALRTIAQAIENVGNWWP